MSALLRAAGLRKTYRRGTESVHALDGVDLELAGGELVALAGRSGSGKSTLLNVLAGWERPEGGTLVWLGRDLVDPSSLDWTEIAVVPQSLGLVEELTVGGNVELPARFGAGREAGRERAGSLMEHLGLSHLAARMPEETSLGEQQRAALARALVARPRLLLADEPTGHQDATWANRVISTLTVAAGEGTTALVATHSNEVASFAARVLRMHEGRIAPG